MTGHMQSLCRSRGIPVLRVPAAGLHRLAGTVTIDLGRQAVIVGEPDSCATEPPPPAVDPAELGSVVAVIADRADIRSLNSVMPHGERVECFFIREEFLCLSGSLRPLDALRAGIPDARRYGRSIGRQVCAMVEEAGPDQRLVMRLLDLRSDDARALSKRTDAVVEPNPELGSHGARWLVDQPYYPHAFSALRRYVDERLGPRAGNLTFAVPFVNDSDEFVRLRRHLEVPPDLPFAVFVETPAAVHSVPDFGRAGATELFVGTKDLVQFYLAADRGNHLVASSYQTRHPAVMAALRQSVESARGIGIPAHVFVLGPDVRHYVDHLPAPDGFMMCAAELRRLVRDSRTPR